MNTFLKFFIITFTVIYLINKAFSQCLDLADINKETECQVLSCYKKGDLLLTRIEGKLFYIHNGEKMTWFAANDFCKQHRMHLAIIETATLNDAIKESLKPLSPANDFETFWFGLNDLAKEGEFRWEHTGAKLIGYNNWGLNQPDNAFQQEDCGAIRMKNTVGLWNDLACNVTSGNFICQVPF